MCARARVLAGAWSAVREARCAHLIQAGPTSSQRAAGGTHVRLYRTSTSPGPTSVTYPAAGPPTLCCAGRRAAPAARYALLDATGHVQSDGGPAAVEPWRERGRAASQRLLASIQLQVKDGGRWRSCSVASHVFTWRYSRDRHILTATQFTHPFQRTLSVRALIQQLSAPRRCCRRIRRCAAKLQ